eukprot:15352427-Alexandrium_andersonii.AAC.1
MVLGTQNVPPPLTPAKAHMLEKPQGSGREELRSNARARREGKFLGLSSLEPKDVCFLREERLLR